MRFIVGLIAACLSLFVSAFADDVTIRHDVVYGHKDGLALTFDVLAPPNANGAAVLSLQSGGWYSNWAPPEKRIDSNRPLLNEGITVLIVHHGSAPKYAVPDAVADVRRCVRFVRMNAGELGIDPARIGVIGGSAGGHLTLMLATTGDDGDPQAEDPVLRQSSRISCGVSYYPPTDLRGWTTNPPEMIKKEPLLGPPLEFDADLEDDVSPLLHVTSDDAPVLMIHGDLDKLVPVSHSQNIVPKFEEAKVGSELLVVTGAKHGYSDEQKKTIVVPAMVKWFKEHLQQQ
jgi:acetyl esterase/lipase